MGDYFVGFIIGACVMSIVFTSFVLPQNISGDQLSSASSSLEQCEKSLARDKTCKLIAIEDK
jgi:hypothetical protein